MDKQIDEATRSEPAPPAGTEGKIYIPSVLYLTLMDSAHSSLDSGHPGSQQTHSLLRNWYWWPHMTNGQTERKIQDIGHFLRSYCQSPTQLEPVHHLGQVHTELPPATHHCAYTLPVLTWLPTVPVPCSGEPSEVSAMD